MAQQQDVPSACADCGSDAYIRLGQSPETMVCAHCYGDRVRSGDVKPASARPPERTEQDSRIHR